MGDPKGELRPETVRVNLKKIFMKGPLNGGIFSKHDILL